MRKNKFRAWDKYNKEMHINIHEADGSSEFITFNSHNEMVKLQPASFSDYLYLEYFTVMQYTGLKDINDVEIYEGDIVEEFENGKSIGVKVVEFGVYEDKYGAFDMKHLGYTAGFSTLPDIVFDKNGFRAEVVGNIYENKELDYHEK